MAFTPKFDSNAENAENRPFYHAQKWVSITQNSRLIKLNSIHPEPGSALERYESGIHSDAITEVHFVAGPCFWGAFDSKMDQRCRSEW
jgi:hypothetical protein